MPALSISHTETEMRKQVIVLALILVMLFSLIGFIDWRDANVVNSSEVGFAEYRPSVADIGVVDSGGGFLIGVFIVVVTGILLVIVIEKGIKWF